MNAPTAPIHFMPPQQERSWPSEGATRAPYWIYSDPEIFKREMEVFFDGPSWHYVGLDCEVPEPGSFRRTWLGTKPILMIRDENGEIVVLENRCAHRGVMVCWEQSGKANDLTCPYHHWNYNLHGELQGLPFLRGVNKKGGMPSDFDKSEHKMRRLRVERIGGSVWATFSEAAAPLTEYLGEEPTRLLHRAFDRPLRLLGYDRQMLPSNWKLYWENTRDPYHASILHTFFVTFGISRVDGEHLSTALNDGRIALNSYKIVGAHASEATKELSSYREDFKVNDHETVQAKDEYGDGLYAQMQIFPSVHLQQHMNTLAMRHMIPKGPGESELAWTYFGYQDDDEELTRLRLKHGNLSGPAGLVAIDDSEVVKQLQTVANAYPNEASFVQMGGVDTEATTTMATENQIRAFYSLYRQAMGI